MANKIILKKSSVTSKVPMTGDLEYGELAINYADGKLYYKTSTNTIASFSANSTTGTVTSISATSSDITISGSPITSSGTLTFALNTVSISKGGTGETTAQAALNALAGGTTAARVLRGNGTAIVLAQVDLTTDVTGTTAIINGGTGQSSFSSGYIRSNGTALSSTATIAGSDISGAVSSATSANAVANSGESSSTATHYVTFVTANSTSTQSINTTNALRFTPSSGVLTAAEFSVTQGTNGSAALITTNTATNQVVDSVSTSVYRTVKYVLQVSSGSAYQTSEILLIHDDTNAYLTEYATIKTTTATLATFDATISSGNLQLLVSPTNAITTVRAVRTAINI